ncbi:sialidase family protein [Planctomicrobium sp. SH661]|uniref:sialidase family protein n=1 Tax=Planctomicrobium sp. SH661 TaxID=3448124 RepID=UPI003F5B3CD0
MSVRHFCLAAVSIMAFNAHAVSAAEPAAKLVDVRKIWDEGAHNAFTDLLFHDGTWYCVFREGKGHVSQEGAIRVLESPDGEHWTSAARITMPEIDLRDPKINVTPDGRLCLCAAGVRHRAKETESSMHSYAWYSTDGKDWGAAIPIGELNHWIWRIVWHKGIGYGVGYTKELDNLHARLYKTEDGRSFTTLVPDMFPKQGYVNETAIVFLPNDDALCLIRRDTSDPSDALLGKSSPPYQDWKFQGLGVRLGGPQMLRLEDGRIIVAGRLNGKTQLWWLDPEASKLTELLTLPSGGDTSYPGLVLRDGKLWVSYYSSHEGKTSIYLARVELQ